MKVFLSWSGDMSRELAEALRDWLPSVLQNVKPFFTPNDIEKGARWGKDIAGELDNSSVGIFCLTKENLSKPWIMFEAGALSKNVDQSRVCPILFNVDSAELQGPLVQFQASPFSKGEILKLTRTLNGALGDGALDDAVLTKVFDKWWPDLDERVQGILAKFANAPASDGPMRSDRELIEEVLDLVRLNSNQSRRFQSSPPVIASLITALFKASNISPGSPSIPKDYITHVPPTFAMTMYELAAAIEFALSEQDLAAAEREAIAAAMETIKRLKHG